MRRREFVACSLAGPWAASSLKGQSALPANDSNPADLRAAFPRLKKEIYLNAAGFMPLGQFSRMGLENYMSYQELGSQSGQGDYVRTMLRDIRKLFAQVIGADVDEIGLIHCTKAGEQIALDAVDALKPNGGIVTNDLHFSGSLNNLIGMKKAGRNVKIIRAENWRVPLDKLLAAIDGDTALVTLSLVSNINGHTEQIKAITDHAHRQGALVYADIIQAAGIVPLNIRELGLDLAACSAYKWLYGVFGTGFLYVSKALQGSRIPDKLFPGRIEHNYRPWLSKPDSEQEALIYEAPKDATRYQPGHVSYLGYCAVYEGLKFLHQVGIENALAHSVKLNLHLKQQLDEEKFTCISPHLESSSIATFHCKDAKSVKDRLEAAGIVVRMMGDRMRVSPALFNSRSDMDTLIKVLNAS